jgi:selenium-binding protein 1
MLSSGWGAPLAFSKGFDPAQVSTHYSSQVHVWDWKARKLTQTLELGPTGLIPLEVRTT